MNKLAFRTARDQVNSFADEGEGLIAKADFADDCRDCEDFLRLGIDACHWLQRADEQFRDEIFDGKRDYDAEVDEALTILYRTWLKPCDFAERWIAQQHQRNLEVENLDEFRRCVNEVRSILRDSNTIDGEMVKLRDQAIARHQRGETVDWETEK